MALQSQAIDSRLEGLKLDDRRIMFDSQLRAVRMDNKPQAANSAPTGLSNVAKKPELDQPIDRVITLLEDLALRLDGLEKKHRHLNDEIRQRSQRDRRWRSVFVVGGLSVAGLLVVRWVMHWI